MGALPESFREVTGIVREAPRFVSAGTGAIPAAQGLHVV
ncbi:hypothetical protein CZ771_03435 [Actinomycetales bacterium JB111]|nr:hypothetical protein CZ771_03435 [Actinomycetales bacterium JB111]